MKHQEKPEQVAARLKEEAWKRPLAIITAGGWKFGYSTPASPISPSIYMFSASLHPEGRGSTVVDWKYLGAVMEHVGCPLERERYVLFTEVATADPNSVLKWAWKGEPA